MNAFSQYLAVILLHEAESLEDEAYSGSFVSLSSKISKLLEGVEVSPTEISQALSILNDFGAARHFENPLTNGYWQINYDNFRYYFIQDKPDYNEEDKEAWAQLRAEGQREYPIFVTYAENGRAFAQDVIDSLRTMPKAEWQHLRESSPLPQIPASDRVVTLGHNQREAISNETAEVIKLLEKENSIDGDEGLRSRIVGQLRAGRELINAQIFRANLLYATVVGALNMLIQKYSGKAIAVAATKLLEMLIEEVFKD